mgnify:CR=1 FL=1
MHLNVLRSRLSSRTPLLAVLLAAALAGCASKTDVNERNFAEALSRLFEKTGAQCLDQVEWPGEFTVAEMEAAAKYPRWTINQYLALQQLGLAGREEFVGPQRIGGVPLVGTDVKQTRFVLTDASKPFQRVTNQGQVKLCWGQKALAKIVKWEGPLKLGDYQEVVVTYLYTIEGEADWAKQPSVNAAFALLKAARDGVGNKEERLALVLTNAGWEGRSPRRLGGQAL